MLRARRRADRHLHPRADAADRLAVVPGLVDADRLRHGAASSASTISATSSAQPRSAATSRARLLNTALYTALSVLLILPLSVALRPDGLPALGCRRHGAAHRAVFHLHGADDRGGAGVVEALFADRRAAQPDARLDRHRAAALAVVARARRWSRSCILNVWQQVGYFTVLAVAGLTQIPGSLYEAAKLDGANALAAILAPSRCRCCGARCCSAR